MKRLEEAFFAAKVVNGSRKLANIDESFIVRVGELRTEIVSP